MIEAFLPRDKVYLPNLDRSGVVVSVRLTTFGTEYLIRYFAEDATPYEVWMYDFEVTKQTANA